MTDAQIRAVEAKKLREVAAFIRSYVEQNATTFGIKRDVWERVAAAKDQLAEALELSVKGVL